VFSPWHQPDRTLLVSEYRQYLIRKYNKEIAIYYKVNPSDSLGPPEKLDFVKSKIKRKIDFHHYFPSKNFLAWKRDFLSVCGSSIITK